MPLLHSLFARLTLVFFLFLLLLGAFCLWLLQTSAATRALEFTQRLNAPIAMYMAEQGDLVDDQGLHGQALADLAPHVMMINPSVEVYLLDADGHVVAQASEADTIVQQPVSLSPIKQFLSDTATYPLYGDNPGHPDEQRIFSAAPILRNGQLLGYVYAILAGEQYRSLSQAIQGDYGMRNLVSTLLGALVLALLGGTLVFFMLTRRLRRLTRRVSHWHDEQPPLQVNLAADSPTGTAGLSSPGVNAPTPVAPQCGFDSLAPGRESLDELDELALAYERMTVRINDQYQALKHSDHNRRELMATISHDLRTPLTSLQGYLETILLKGQSLSAEQRHRYLQTALRQSQRLARLVAQLFELSKLTADGAELYIERFSLLELVHDCLQDFALRAQEQNVSLEVTSLANSDDAIMVDADIALIQRALENLLDNALRYTPHGGTIRIQLSEARQDHRVHVALSDTGCGMSAHLAEQVFEPGISANARDQAHAGLGLAIVERIVALHAGRIAVEARPGHGTTFSFSLPGELPAHQK